jgi:hypothetical protein
VLRAAPGLCPADDAPVWFAPSVMTSAAMTAPHTPAMPATHSPRRRLRTGGPPGPYLWVTSCPW